MNNLSGLVDVLALLGMPIVGAFFSRKSGSRPADAPKNDKNDAWNHYMTNGHTRADRDKKAVEALRQLPRDESEGIRESVQNTLNEALAEPEAQTALRRAIMDATDRFVLADAHGDERETTSPRELASVVEAGVLRSAAILRFNDYDKDDWYAHYLKVAQMNSRNVARMVRKTIQGEAASLESALHDPLTRTMAEVRRSLLSHPPRTAVRRSDNLANSVEALRMSPSQHEIDALTRIMGDRFKKLFSGQVYRLADGEAVDPTGSFQIDASLLYTILALNFRHATDAWRNIMVEALGDYRGAMEDEESLLSLARACHRSWEKRREDGPLNEFLNTACRTAFREGEGWESIAAGMTEDASFLSGEIQRVVARS